MNRTRSAAALILLAAALVGCSTTGSSTPAPTTPAAATPAAASASPASTAPPTTGPTPGADDSSSLAPGAVQVAGTHVAMVPPDGFVTATTFPGFQHDASGSSVLVAELAGPYSTLADGMTDVRLASEGVEVTSRTDVTIDGRPSLLVEGRQESAGTTFGKVILVTGTEALSTVITGNFPIDDTAAGADVRAAILTTSFDPDRPTDPEAALSFVLAPAPPLRLAGVTANVASYSEDGSLGTAGAVLVVAPSLGSPEIADVEAYARQALGQTATLANVEVESATDVTIAGLPGIVLVGTADRTTRDGRFLVYQVLLSGGSGYVRMLGMCPAERRAECLEMFERSAATYRPKP